MWWKKTTWRLQKKKLAVGCSIKIHSFYQMEAHSWKDTFPDAVIILAALLRIFITCYHHHPQMQHRNSKSICSNQMVRWFKQVQTIDLKIVWWLMKKLFELCRHFRIICAQFASHAMFLYQWLCSNECPRVISPMLELSKTWCIWFKNDQPPNQNSWLSIPLESPFIERENDGMYNRQNQNLMLGIAKRNNGYIPYIHVSMFV